MPLPSELMPLILEVRSLLQESATILTSEQDISYFRNRAQKRAPILPKQEEFVARAPVPLPKIKLPEQEKPIIQPPILEVVPPKEKIEPPPEMPHFGTLQSIFQKIAPHLPLILEIPDDAEAKKKANQWKTKNQATPISIFYSQESPPHKELLQALAKAIDIYFGQSHLIHADPIEKEDNWDAFLSTPHLKWIILCDSTLWQMPHLMRHYKENPHQKMRTLKDKRLFILPDLSLYLKDPLLKRSLWKGLCQTLSS